MTLQEIKEVVSNKLANLLLEKERAKAMGDLARYVSFDSEIAETEETLKSL